MAVLYRLAGGYSILDYTRFTIFGVSLFALGLYFWMHETRIPRPISAYASVAVTLGFRMADILRFPAAVHTAAWIPWILYFSTRILFARPDRYILKPAAGLLFTMVCFLTGGYPYYWYYLVFLVIPFILIQYIPHFRKLFREGTPPPPIKNLLALAVSAFTGIAICSPYLLNMLVLLQSTLHRAG